MNVRNLAHTLLAASLVLMSGQPMADDIDIYLQPQTKALPGDVRLWPMVMLGFSIDSEMGSPVCSGNVVDNLPVRESFSEDCQLLIPAAGSGYDADAFVNANTIAGWPTSSTEGGAGVDGPITITRAGLYAAGTVMVLRGIPGARLRIGMMIPHDNSPSSVTSNGGYIALGFGPTQSQVDLAAGGVDGYCTNYALPDDDPNYPDVAEYGGACDQAAMRLMHLQNAAYVTRLKWIGSMLSGTSNVSHKYALTELNYELRRYLLGGGVYRGYLGNDDYRTTADDNLRCDTAGAPCFEFTEKYWSTPGGAIFDDPDISTPFASGDSSTFRDSDWFDGGLEKNGSKNPIAWDEAIIESDVYKDPRIDDLICSGVNVINFAKNASDDIADIPNTDDLENFLSGPMTTYNDPEYMGIALTKGGGGGKKGGDDRGADKTNNYLHQVLISLRDMDLLRDDGTPETTGQQGVKSHFVFSTPTLTSDEHLLAISGGGAGSTAYSSSEVKSFVAGLTTIFQEILSQSATFVAPSVPPSAINRTRSVNEVFMALFEAEKEPFWPGNVKKLRIEQDVGRNWYLAATGTDGALKSAINDETGRIALDVTTYWTRTSTARLDHENFNEIDATAETDGRQVDRGGSGQQIDPRRYPDNQVAANRTLYTNVGSNLVDFASNIGLSSTLRDWAIGKGRAWRVGDTLHSRPVAINYGAREAGAVDYTSVNPDIRLLYGSNDGFLRMVRNTAPGNFSEDDLRYNTLSENGGVQSGDEVWAFMPMEVADKIDWLANPAANPPRHPITVDGAPVIVRLDHDRDGVITADRSDSDYADEDLVWAFFGLRRGGKAYYALDITDPDVPLLMWTIGKDGVDTEHAVTLGQSAGDFDELAQTWSIPSVGQLEVNGELKNVLVFGGGYNGDDDGMIGYAGNAMRDGSNTLFDCSIDYWVDTDAPTMSIAEGLGDDAPNRGCDAYEGNDNEGNALFIVDAETGNLIWKLRHGDAMTNIHVGNDSNKVFEHPRMLDSVPADVTAADMDSDGILDRIYFGDTGGVLWRVNLADNRECVFETGAGYCPPEDDVPGYWHAYPLLSVGRHSDSGIDRRFMTRPDVISSFDNQDASGNYDGVLIGTGDREDPNSLTENEIFIHYKDAYTDSRRAPYLRSEGPVDNPDYTTAVAQFDDLALRTFVDKDTYTFTDPDGATTLADQLQNGWIVDLPEDGEKVVGHAVTLAGVTYFTTHRPGGSGDTDPNPCIPSAGWGRMYILGIERGEPVPPPVGPGSGSEGEASAAYLDLKSPGIPPPVVPVGTEDGVRLLIPGEAGLKDPDADLFFPTFWRREDN